MLDKDQYNQEEYNDYYKQETQSAEIKGKQEESSNKKGIFILLGLILLSVAGYFGYRTFVTSKNNVVTSNTVNEIEKNTSTQEEVTPPVTLEPIQSKKETINLNKQSSLDTAEVNSSQTTIKVEKNTTLTQETETISNTIQSTIEETQKMSPDEIAQVVQLVMSQIKTKEKEEETLKNEDKNIDKQLMSELSGSDVEIITDNENTSLTTALSKVDSTKDTKINKNTASTNTYNKVKIEENSGSDQLSKLSGQISDLISDKKTPDVVETVAEQEYTQELQKELVIRENEMRIIIVKKGDTLGKIAKRAYGNASDFKKIYKANPDILNRPDRIYIGQKLRIPK